MILQMATFTNYATISYGGVTKNSNIVTGELRDLLSMTKTAVSASFTPGGRVTYAISLTNSGSTPFTSLTLTDDLGAYTSGTLTLVPLTYIDGTIRYYQNGVLQPSPTITSQNSLVISELTIPANGSVLIIYEAETTSFAPIASGGQITNTAALAGNGITTLTDSATIAVDPRPELSISKSICPSTIVENGELTYTFVIQNSGSSAASDVVVSDTFDPILSSIRVTLDGNTLDTTAYSYNETTGVFSTNSGVISVPAAAFTQTQTGEYIISPGVSVLTISGRV